MRRIKLQLLLCVAIIVAVFFMVMIKNYDNIDENLTYEFAEGSESEIVITGYTGVPKKLEIPAEIDGYSVIAIDENAFAEIKTLKSVVIAEGVREIREMAFSGCSSLSSLSLPSTLQKIGEAAFYGCSSLKRAEMPYALEYIADAAFEGCSALEYMNLSENVSYIGVDAFMHCSSLVLDCPGNEYAIEYASQNNISTDVNDSNSNTMKKLYTVIAITFVVAVAGIIVFNKFVLKKGKSN